MQSSSRDFPPSPAFDAFARGTPFRDVIAVRVHATPAAIFRAARHVTLKDMPIARWLGEVRYLPSRLAGHASAADPYQPFLSILTDGGTLVLDDNAPREIITGSAGQLHRLVDQAPVAFQSADAFRVFANPAHEKLYMSLRVAPAGGSDDYWLLLEHATVALSEQAARRFSRYWRVIKPGGAFVTKQLLNAIRTRAEHDDELLDQFIPDYEVRECHRAVVPAPPDETLRVAKLLDLQSAPVARAIFRAREILLRAVATPPRERRGLVEETRALGWVMLAERPGREYVSGAVTRPWEPNVTFRSIPAESFATFAEADYVKIVWNLRADPAPAGGSLFSTETRVVSTDAAARAKFRRYWRRTAPGIIALRWLMLRQLKRELGPASN